MVPGLAIRVTPAGHRTFVLIARYPGSWLTPLAEPLVSMEPSHSIRPAPRLASGLTSSSAAKTRRLNSSAPSWPSFASSRTRSPPWRRNI